MNRSEINTYILLRSIDPKSWMLGTYWFLKTAMFYVIPNMSSKPSFICAKQFTYTPQSKYDQSIKSPLVSNCYCYIPYSSRSLLRRYSGLNLLREDFGLQLPETALGGPGAWSGHFGPYREEITKVQITFTPSGARRWWNIHIDCETILC